VGRRDVIGPTPFTREWLMLFQRLYTHTLLTGVAMFAALPPAAGAQRSIRRTQP
jgi:hypothetical protein